jgi:hypothetical protein
MYWQPMPHHLALRSFHLYQLHRPAQQFRACWSGVPNRMVKYLDGGQNIVIVMLNDKTDAAVQQASGMEASQFKTFWQRLAFSGRG